MITLLIILAFIVVALIYALQFQIVRDYQPYINIHRVFNRSRVHNYGCKLNRYSIFDWKRVQ